MGGPGNGSDATTASDQFEVKVSSDDFVVEVPSKKAKAGNRSSAVEAAPKDITCNGTPESPHYSKGSAQGRGSVIAKVRVHCVGTPGKVTVYFSGRLGHIIGGKCSPNTYVAGPPQNSWSDNTPSQTLWVNATKASTFYLPPTKDTTRRTATRTWVADSKMVVNGLDDGWRQKRRFTGINCY